jgi:cytochrome b561
VKKAYRRVRRYGRTAISLHWIVAAGIAFLFLHGMQMMHLDEAERLPALNLHRSVGVVIFALVLVRIGWRCMHPPPHFRMPPLQAWVAHYVHLFIYGLLVANGIAGVVGWITSGDPVVFFGIELLKEGERHTVVTRMCVAVGGTTARALLVVIALHALAALKHQAVDRDRLIERMWPGRTMLVSLRTAELLLRSKKRRRHDGQHAAHRVKQMPTPALKSRRTTADSIAPVPARVASKRRRRNSARDAVAVAATGAKRRLALYTKT